MPWKESSVEEERLRFVARLLNGESMTEVCRSFGIPRKTGYKIFNRYKEIGPVALSDRSRRPARYANQPPEQLERSAEHTSELQSLMRISYAVICLRKKTQRHTKMYSMSSTSNAIRIDTSEL